jgi:hypothetical protein
VTKGRKYIMMGGMLLAILLYRPIYKQMFETTNVKNKTEIVANTKIVSELKENKNKLWILFTLLIKVFRWNHFA